MSTLRHLFAALAVASLLAGCGLPAGRPQPVTFHVLEVPPPAALAAPATPGPTLLLGDTEAQEILKGLNLVYSRSPGTLGQYQYARWSEPPARRLNLLLRQRLEAGGMFRSVAELGTGIGGDVQLNTRLLDFHHEAVQAPGLARVALEAELLDRRDGRLLARQVFQAEAPAAGYDAAAAARALGQASGRLLDDLTQWLARVRMGDAR
ncbi:MAG TPA: ABC-type transport auxiliary lipoprotein family protein [Thiobacillaceae bacterium]|nr:ABC-type transport auxiliary lipoprotein family protein [Thiobacillaceae bacterium]